MPIRFTCPCGKSLKIPDRHAGKKVKCPGCARSLIAPASSSQERPAPAPQEPQSIVFACACGQQMQAKAEYGGQATACPACGQAVVIPGAPIPAPGGDPTSSRGGFAFSDEDGSGGRSPRRSRGDRTGALSWLLLLTTLVLFGGVGTGAFLFFRGDTPEDLTYVPADTDFFVSIRPADIWSVPAFQQAFTDRGREQISKLADRFGLKPTDIERITIVVKDLASSKTGWVIVATRGPYSQDLILENTRMKKSEKKHKEKVYFGWDEHAMYFPSDRVFIVSDQKGVEACIEQTPRTGREASPLNQAFRKAAGGNHHLVLAVAPPTAMLEKGAEIPLPVGPDGASVQAAWLKQLQAVTVTVQLGASLEIETTGSLSSPDSAREAKSALEQVKDSGEALFAKASLKPEAEKALKNLLDSLSIQQSGNDVLVRCDTELDTPALEILMRLLEGNF